MIQCPVLIVECHPWHRKDGNRRALKHTDEHERALFTGHRKITPNKDAVILLSGDRLVGHRSPAPRAQAYREGGIPLAQNALKVTVNCCTCRGVSTVVTFCSHSPRISLIVSDLASAVGQETRA